MTKAELLAQLEAAYDAVGEPIAQQGTRPADGSQRYSVQVCEVGGDAAGYRNIMFVVRDEGTASEVALYEQSEPVDETVRRTAFLQWIKSVVTADPDSYKGLIIHWWNEVTEEAVFSKLDADQQNAEKLTRVHYWARRDPVEVRVITGFDIDQYQRDCRVWPE